MLIVTQSTRGAIEPWFVSESHRSTVSVSLTGGRGRVFRSPSISVMRCAATESSTIAPTLAVTSGVAAESPTITCTTPVAAAESALCWLAEVPSCQRAARTECIRGMTEKIVAEHNCQVMHTSIGAFLGLKAEHSI